MSLNLLHQMLSRMPLGQSLSCQSGVLVLQVVDCTYTGSFLKWSTRLQAAKQPISWTVMMYARLRATKPCMAESHPDVLELGTALNSQSTQDITAKSAAALALAAPLAILPCNMKAPLIVAVNMKSPWFVWFTETCHNATMYPNWPVSYYLYWQ